MAANPNNQKTNQPTATPPRATATAVAGTPPTAAGATGAASPAATASPQTAASPSAAQSASASLPGPNAQELTQLQVIMAQCLNEDNNVRRAAETQLDRALTMRRDWFIVGLLRLLRGSTSKDVRVLAAIHLRNKLLIGEPTLYEALEETIAAALRKELLQALTSETDRKVRHQIGETVSELGRNLLCKEESWPDLVPFLFQCAKQPQEHLRVLSHAIFGSLAEHLPDNATLQGTLLAMYKAALSDPSSDVKAAAFVAACKSITNQATDKALKPFQALVPDLFRVLGQFLTAKKESEARACLVSLVEVSTEEATFLRPHLDNFAVAMDSICKTVSLEDALRQLAMEAMVAICEAAPGMARKSPNLMKHSINSCFSLMMSVEDDNDWFSKPESDEILDGSNFECGEMSIDRVSLALGAQKTTPIVYPLIISMLKQEDWKLRHAALSALGQTAEVMPFEKLPMTQIMRFVKDKHPRVRAAACACLAHLANDFQPGLQIAFHDSFIPCVMEPLNESTLPRLQCVAANALFNFIDYCEEKTLAPYVKPILIKLVDLLRTSHVMVKEQVLPTIAGMASSAPIEFLKYYDSVVPLVKQVLIQAKGKELRSLRSKAMEAISFIGIHIGKEKFRDDAKDVMAVLVDITKRNDVAADDFSQQYMLQAWTRLCTILGADFVPVLPLVLPPILIAAQKQPEQPRDDKESTGELRVSNSTKAFTSTLEDKANAASMLVSLVHDLKQHYFPYLAKTAQIMIPCMDFYMNDEVRSYAIAIQPDLINCAVCAMEQKMTTIDVVRALFRESSNYMLRCFKNEPNTEILMALVSSMRSCIESVETIALQCLDANALLTIGEALFRLLVKSHERILRRENQSKDEDFDEESKAVMEGENQEEDELNFTVSQCMGALIKSHKTLFLPVFDKLLPHILRMLEQNTLPQSKKVAIYIFDDIVDYLGQASLPYFAKFVPTMIQCITSEDPELAQAAAYGVGICAHHGGATFAPYVEESAKRLAVAMKHQNAKVDLRRTCTDNMISALGKIAHFYNKPQFLPVWLAALPLSEDVTEGEGVYAQLCTYIEKNNPAILGKSYSNMPKIISIFASILGTEFVDAELTARITNILNQMKKLPPQVMTQLMNTFPADQKAKIAEMFQKLPASTAPAATAAAPAGGAAAAATGAATAASATAASSAASPTKTNQ